jgi:hypothetical protein
VLRALPLEPHPSPTVQAWKGGDLTQVSTGSLGAGNTPGGRAG